ncbi:C80 family cysteine peptidase [Roseateles aquatilis]|uniref:C80 family cysteine peptidase n=1 Tax=Roseateles aquatilis TaxID=431061 RepID=UPI0011328C21|nr:C80 family cysteine peptidase [Roseateles aquatilis]
MSSPLPSRLRIKLPQPPQPASTAKTIAVARRAPPSVSEARASLPLLLLKPSGGMSVVHPEEGRMRVILLSLQQAMRGDLVAPSPLGDEHRRQLERDVTAQLTSLLNDARIGPSERQFLQRLAGRLVGAVLDGDYVGLLGSGAPRDTLTTALLDPQALETTTTLRPWRIGDLDTKRLGSGARAMLRQTIPVHRASALLAEGLSFAAERAGQLSDTAAPEVLARRVAIAKLASSVMQSGMSGAPFLVDLDQANRLSTQDDLGARSHLHALNGFWGRLSTLSRLNMIGPLMLLSRSPDNPEAWQRVRSSVYVTRDEALMRNALPDAFPSIAPTSLLPPTERIPLPLLHDLAPDLEQVLDRRAGLVSLIGVAGPQAPSFLVRLPVLAPSARADEVHAQDRQLAQADSFSVALFGDPLPFHHERLPPEVTLTEDEFRVGHTLVARQDEDQWRFAPHGTALVRHIFGASSFARARVPDLSTWSATTGTYSAVLPADTAADARSTLLRVFVQLENDKDLNSVGATLSRMHPDELVWLRLHPDQGFTVVRGQSLLRNATPRSRIKLIVNGHGHTSWTTKERLLGGRTATELARELKALMTELPSTQRPLPAVESISLLGCALETQAVDRSFGREFVEAAHTASLVRAGAETTLYTDTLLLDFGARQLRRSTRPYPGAPAVRRAAGTTWAFQFDADTRTVQVRDKFPHGGDGVLADRACCVVLESTYERREAKRSLALSRALILDRLQLNTRFHEIIARYRPAGWVLLPHLREGLNGVVLLTYLDLEKGQTTMRSISAPADRQALRAGTALVAQGLAELQALVALPPVPNAGIDLLTLGLLALTLQDAARGSTEGDRYQQALWYLGITQGGFQVSADVADMVVAVRVAMRQATGNELADLVRQTAALSRSLAAMSSLAQVAAIGIDLQQLIWSLSEGTGSQATTAAIQFGLDAAGMTLAGLAVAADLLNLTLLAAAAEGLAVPLAGLSIGIVELNRAVSGATASVSRNMRPLHEIDKGYGEPLRRVPAGPGHPHEVLIANGWAPLKRIDFRNNQVSFADTSIGATALHPSQLYWQAGSRRLHDWWISDGNDRQSQYSLHGLELDLWTLMRNDQRMAIPRAAPARAARPGPGAGAHDGARVRHPPRGLLVVASGRRFLADARWPDRVDAGEQRRAFRRRLRDLHQHGQVRRPVALRPPAHPAGSRARRADPRDGAAGPRRCRSTPVCI